MVKRMTLIEKEDVLHQIGILPLVWEYGQGVNDCYEIVKQAPTVDAIPVEWIQRKIDMLEQNMDSGLHEPAMLAQLNELVSLKRLVTDWEKERWANT